MPAWSPAETTIAFASYHSDPAGARVIWVINPSSANLKDISTHGTGEWLWPSWSPRGGSIVHSRYTPQSLVAQIFTMRSDGTSAQQLTASTSPAFSPAWAPDSTEIAFVRQTPQADEIWLMDADGGRQRRLVEGTDPSWLPSGRGLIFARPSSEASTTFGLINRDGSGLRYLTPTLPH
jgi:TolB protein